MDPPEYEWYYNADEEAIVAMTTIVVHTYFYLGRMHGVEEPDIPPILAVIPEAPLMQPLAPWDFPLSLLSDIGMEPISPGLPSIKILPPLAVLIIKMSSTVTLVPMAVWPPILEYHPGASPTYEEDPSEEMSMAVSRVPGVAELSCAHRAEVLSREPNIIRTPFIP